MRIAVDGPSGSGKSTISKALAKKFGISYLDTGAMYRAVTAWLLAGKDYLPENWVVNLFEVDIKIETNPENFQIKINNLDVTDEIRTQRITDFVSQVSAEPKVRDWMVRLQKEIMKKSDGIVMEGRDIGTVVMPVADVKIFIEADLEKRTARRALELTQSSQITFESLKNRDQLDSSRAISPLAKAPDAVLLDTTDLNITDAIDAAFKIVDQRLNND